MLHEKGRKKQKFMRAFGKPTFAAKYLRSKGTIKNFKFNHKCLHCCLAAFISSFLRVAHLRARRHCARHLPSTRVR